MVFYTLLLFQRSTWLLNRNHHVGDDFFVFYKFRLPSTFLLPPPLSYRCSGVSVVRVNLSSAKRFICVFQEKGVVGIFC